MSPLPTAVAGVRQPVVSLDGNWKLSVDPPDGFWSNDVDPSSWASMAVPGQPTMAGYAIVQDKEFAYKRKVHVDGDLAGKRVVLQFDGVYSYARVWVNGHLVTVHEGGFTTWEADITQYVTPGTDAWLTVGVTDRSDDPSDGSGYAHNLIGGIIRSARLLALPAKPLTRFDVDTMLGANLKDAVMRVYLAAPATGADASVALRLRDPEGESVLISSATVPLTAAHPEVYVDVPVHAPRLWDTEHPWLYTLEATESSHGRAVEVTSREFGFRQITIEGNKFLLNGRIVKLRGVDHHHISPTGGRSTSASLDDTDMRMFRDANINYIRTTHYPPTPAVLAAADRYGIVVEEEAPVCFASGPSVSDPQFKARLVGAVAEMLARDRSHPSVVMYSASNESSEGPNIEAERAFMKAEDPGRPVVAGLYAGSEAPYTDITVDHYPTWGATPRNFTPTKPILFDEYAAVPSSTFDDDETMHDPTVHDEWGIGLAAVWGSAVMTDGVMGGAIWAANDDVFLRPDAALGYGEWGITDVWRRPKPEYWMTKKAYSPVRINDSALPLPAPNRRLTIPVSNWFDYTNLNQITVKWTVAGRSGTLSGPDVAPHGSGSVVLPVVNPSPDAVVRLQFFRTPLPTSKTASLQVDDYELRFAPSVAAVGVDTSVAEPAKPTTIHEDENHITVSGEKFQIPFDKNSGLVDGATFDGQEVIRSGPTLNLGGGALDAWAMDSIHAAADGENSTVEIKGHYGSIAVTFAVSIDGHGLMVTTYTLDNSPGGAIEIGLSYTLNPAVDRLSWRRQALYSVYPESHLGRPVGVANKSGPVDVYGVRPTWPWDQSTKQFGLFGKDDPGLRGTADFRSSKQHILYGSAILAGSDARVRAESDGSDSIRMETDEQGMVRLVDNNYLGFPSLNYSGQYPNMPSYTQVPAGYTNSVRLRLTDRDGVAARLAQEAARKAAVSITDLSVAPTELVATVPNRVKVTTTATNVGLGTIKINVPAGWQADRLTANVYYGPGALSPTTTFVVIPPAGTDGPANLTVTATAGYTTKDVVAPVTVGPPGVLTDVHVESGADSLVEGLASQVVVRATASSPTAGSLRLLVPDGWTVSPESSVDLAFPDASSLSQTVVFTVTPPAGSAGDATLRVVASAGGRPETTTGVPAKVSAPGLLTSVTGGAPLLAQGAASPVVVRATASSPTAGSLRLLVPDGWTVSPASSVDIVFPDMTSLTQTVTFIVTPPVGSAGPASLEVRGSAGGHPETITEVPVVVHRLVVDDNDPSLSYSPPPSAPDTPPWYQQTNQWSTGGYRDTWSINSTAGDSVSYTFTGTSVTWVGNTQSNFGMADVYLDGVLVAENLDLYSPTPVYQQALYTAAGLTDAEHTLKIVVTGAANPNADGVWVVVDAFAVG